MKKAVLGIDIGGSTTKIVGFDAAGHILEPMSVRATDPVTSFYGAFGTFTSKNGLELGDIGRVMTTGVGSAFIKSPVYGLACETMPEFTCTGRGGLYLSGLDKAIVVSMGTGTAIVYARKDERGGEEIVYLGGTGVGGGTLSGLASKLLRMDNLDHVFSLAEGGDLSNIDLRIGDITSKDMELPQEMTAANFGRISDLATQSDIALGIVNLVIETIGMCAIFAARSHDTADIVLTGKLACSPLSERLFANLSSMFNVNFIIPPHAGFGTVIGAALSVVE